MGEGRKRGKGGTREERKTNWWHSVQKAGNAPEAGELYKSAGRSKAFQSQAVSCFVAFFFKPGPMWEQCGMRGIFRCWEVAGRRGNLTCPKRQQLKS